MPTATPTRVTVSFMPQDWIVRKGHRIVLVLESSNVAWAVPSTPGLGVEVRHDASRLLIPVVGAGSEPATPATPAPIPGARTPSPPLPSRLDAQRSLRVRARAQRKLRLRVTGRAPREVRVTLSVLRGRRTVARRTVIARSGRFALTFRLERPGAYRVSATVRTRDGLVTKRAPLVRLRKR